MKVLKWVGIVFAVLFVIGIIAALFETDEPPRDCRRPNILREYDNENTKLHS